MGACPQGILLGPKVAHKQRPHVGCPQAGESAKETASQEDLLKGGIISGRGWLLM